MWVRISCASVDIPVSFVTMLAWSKPGKQSEFILSFWWRYQHKKIRNVSNRTSWLFCWNLINLGAFSLSYPLEAVKGSNGDEARSPINDMSLLWSSRYWIPWPDSNNFFEWGWSTKSKKKLISQIKTGKQIGTESSDCFSSTVVVRWPAVPANNKSIRSLKRSQSKVRQHVEEPSIQTPLAQPMSTRSQWAFQII